MFSTMKILNPKVGTVLKEIRKLAPCQKNSRSIYGQQIAPRT